MKTLLLNSIIVLTFSNLCAQSPGGVNTNLAIWLKADTAIVYNGSNEITSLNLAASSPAQSISIIDLPRYKPDGINYNSSILFNGTCYLQGNTNILNFTDFYAVTKISNTFGLSNTGAVLGTTGSATDNFFFHLENSNLYSGNSTDYVEIQNIGNSIPFSLLHNNIAETSTNQVIEINAYAFINDGTGDPNPFDGTPVIGARGTEALTNGSEIAEVILFTDAKSSTEKLKIESYLGIKYSITLGDETNPINYLASDGSTIWTGNANYQNKIIGIGRDHNSALNVKQSKSADDSTRIYISTLTSLNSSNSGTISQDRAFIILGNNAKIACADVTTASEIPSGIYSRIAKEWLVFNTNFVEDFNIDITLNSCANLSSFDINDIRLLVDDDGDFSNASIVNQGGGLAFSVNGNILTIIGISNGVLPQNNFKYFTIASVSSSTPLPVELTKFNLVQLERKVLIEWETVSEMNNDYFIIEKSTDNINWSVLAQIKAAGNSTEKRNYFTHDFTPNLGTNYYRLKQIDMDGKVKSYESKVLYYNTSISSVYPNPSNESISFPLSNNTIELLNAFGQKILDINNNDSKSLNISNLQSGIYFMKYQDGTILKFQKI